MASTLAWNGVEGQPWLTLGDGFVGYISGLRLYDFANEPLLSMPESNGQFDANGAANIAVNVTEAALSYNTTVIVKDHSGKKLPVTILPWQNFNRYSEGVAAVY
ncbi:MAG: hypothetical protein MJK04_02825, partial [Psychrosphaera sp.]|nr:hypothetical protein [Psychrosphaera sp.]